jgi:hypothetical protein
VRLQITAGPDAGKTIEPAGERFTIGREDVDFLLSDDEVSRRHIALRTLADGKVELTDLGSRNGTRVDGERIAEPRTLSGGEEIKLGMTTIVVEAPPPPAAGETVVAGGGATAVSPQPPVDEDATVPVAEIPPGLGPTDAPTAPLPAQTPPPPPPAAPPQPVPPVPGTPPPPASAVRGAAPQWQRVTALVTSIVVVLIAVFFAIVAVVALGLTPCDDFGVEDAFADPSASCYDNSTSVRAIATVVTALGAILSCVFLWLSIQFFSRSRRGGAVLLSGVGAVVLIGAGYAISAI